MIRIEKFRKAERPDLADKAFAIRQKVFVDEQSVDPALEYDIHENESWHYLLLENNKPVATARWRQTSNGIKLERFATLKEDRNRGLGRVLLKRVLQDIFPLKKAVYLHSQLKAVSFYQRQEFVKEGEMFVEAGINHFKMVYRP